MIKITDAESADRYARESMVEFTERFISQVRMELWLETDVEQAAESYLVLVALHSHLPAAVEPDQFHEVAPLIAVTGPELDAIMDQAKAKRAAIDAEEERMCNMMIAKCRVDAAIKQHGQDSMEARMEMAKALEFLPPDVKADLDRSARELGLMPPASGYTADGEPVFTTADLANFYGMDVQEVEETAREHMMTVDASTIHKPQ